MKIDFEEIKKIIENGNLADLSRETGIPYRTLQDWKLGKNKWLKEAEKRLTKIQKFINEKLEESKMEELYLFANLSNGDKKDYMKELAKYQVTKEPKYYTFTSELNDRELAEYYEAGTLYGRITITTLEDVILLIDDYINEIIDEAYEFKQDKNKSEG